MYVDRAESQAACRLPVIAIIGGGYSGAAVALQLARSSSAHRIVVYEPRAEIGRGLAYSTPDPDHRLNVPDSKMTLFSGEPHHFRNWLSLPEAPPLPAGSATMAGDIFAPRCVFGQYVSASLAPALKAGQIEHVQACVTAIRREGSAFTVHDTKAQVQRADVVVLAVSHPPPSLLPELAGLANDPSLVADFSAPEALAGIAPQDRVLIVGAGLTSADILATLMRQGARVPVHVLSRHGWRSQPHGPKQPETLADFTVAPATTALTLLKDVRSAVQAEAARGVTWHAVFDKLRAQGPTIWAALSFSERQRFLRHLRALWDIHRFRIAPQTYATVSEAERANRAIFHAAHLVSAERVQDGILVTLRPRGAKVTRQVMVDKVVLATGPAHAQVIAGNPALASLRDQGLVQADRLKLGIATALEARAIGEAGPVPGLFVAGPLARGTVGELMGVPEVTAWAEHVARQILSSVPVSAAAK